MATIAQLNVNLAANTANFSKGMQKAQKDAKAFQSAVGAMAKTFAGVFSTGALIGLAKSSVAAFEEERIAIAQLDASLKSTGNAAGVTTLEIQRLAAQRQNVTNFADDATIGMASVLATFTRIRGPVFTDAIVAIQDLSAKLGQDLQSSAIQVGKALNDPVAGLKALKKVGVSFNETQVETIKRMVEGNNIIGAQKLILGQLKTEFGGAAEAGASAFKQLENAWGDFKEKLGEPLAGPLKDRVGEMKSIMDAILPSAAASEGAAIGARKLGKGSIPDLEARIRENMVQRQSVVAAISAAPLVPEGPNTQFESLVSSLNVLFGESDQLRRELSKAKKLDAAIKGTLSTTGSLSSGEGLAQRILFGGEGRAPGAAKSVLGFFGKAASRTLGQGGFAGTPFAQLGPLAFAEQQKSSVFAAGGTLESGSREALSALARFKTSADDIPKQSLEVQKKTLTAIEDQNLNTQRLEIVNIA